MNDKMRRFEAAVRAHETIGSAHPQDFAEIEAEYQKSRNSLQGYLNYLEFQAKQADLHQRREAERFERGTPGHPDNDMGM